jgi:hypothetical protein
MGTSKGFPTPSGGDWTKVKHDITDVLNASTDVSIDQIIGGTLTAAGGFGRPSGPLVTGGGVSAGGTRGGSGASGGRAGGGRGAVGRAVTGLGAFGTAVRDRGLDGALSALGLDELRGRPAAEVIARIAEHFADGVPGVEGEVLTNALRDAIFEAAALAGDRNYEDLAKSLQSYLDDAGIEGLVELFLTNLLFDRIWFFIQHHVESKSDDLADARALASAVEAGCRSHVRTQMEGLKEDHRFDSVDWFGRGGQEIGQAIASDIESRLTKL